MDRSKKVSVLLIEDDEDDYLLTSDLFDEIATTEFTITWSDNVETGIQELQTGGHDICLIDYRLGPVTGVDVLETCREALRTTPAIVLTGAHSAEVDDASSRAGASDYLVKSELTADILERSVRYVLQRSDSDARIEYLAFHDPLTDLPNRVLFTDRVTQALARTARSESEVSVIFFDLDNFKDINDTRGHAAGDLLLTQVTNRIRGILRPSDTIARLGGDEFAMCMEAPPGQVHPQELIARIQAALVPAFDIDGAASVTVSASFGVSSTADPTTPPEELLRNADIAMYEAKRDGKNTSAYYERSMHDSLQRRIALEHDLRDAIQCEQLEVHYQPFVDLADGSIVGFEALCRWDHPVLGKQQSAEFIDIAERSGMIVELGNFVMQEAVRQAVQWTEASQFQGFMSVNVSPQQFLHAGFVDSLVTTLDSTGISPQRLVIEFTESVMAGDVDTMVGVLDKVSELGVGIALDDFGTGYSSLSNVHLLPISILKVDRSFVIRHRDVKGHSMLSTIATMGKNLGLLSIAEGVETTEQLADLRALGFTLGQGYLFSAAVPGGQVPSLLAAPSQLPESLVQPKLPFSAETPASE